MTGGCTRKRHQSIETFIAACPRPYSEVKQARGAIDNEPLFIRKRFKRNKLASLRKTKSGSRRCGGNCFMCDFGGGKEEMGGVGGRVPSSSLMPPRMKRGRDKRRVKFSLLASELEWSRRRSISESRRRGNISARALFKCRPGTVQFRWLVTWLTAHQVCCKPKTTRDRNTWFVNTEWLNIWSFPLCKSMNILGKGIHFFSILFPFRLEYS